MNLVKRHCNKCDTTWVGLDRCFNCGEPGEDGGFPFNALNLGYENPPSPTHFNSEDFEEFVGWLY